MSTTLRTCVACRKRDETPKLVRLTATAGVVAVGGDTGRGAWVHRTPDCVEEALASGRLARALKVGRIGQAVSDKMWEIAGVKPPKKGH